MPEALNISTGFQYAVVVLHVETAKHVPYNSELTLLVMQWQQTIRDRDYPLYITHIHPHTGLLSSLTQDNDEID